MLRWYVNVSHWLPSQDEFESIVQTLGNDERQSILRYIQLQDRKRALVSRLLQRAAIRQVCGCSESDVRIQRTKGQKPFCVNA